MKLSNIEIAKLREVLQKSIGDYSNQLSDQEVGELGITLLQTTAVLLKARCKTLNIGRVVGEPMSHLPEPIKS